MNKKDYNSEEFLEKQKNFNIKDGIHKIRANMLCHNYISNKHKVIPHSKTIDELHIMLTEKNKEGE